MKPILKALAHSGVICTGRTELSSVICTGRTELSFNDTGGRSSTRSLENRMQRLRKEIYRVINSGESLPKFHEIDDGQEYISDNDGISWRLLNLLLYGIWHKKNPTNFQIPSASSTLHLHTI